ncbi:ribosomal-protein-alanine N-acetyltransferase [Psychrobacillus sp. OK028]|uniref:GNAT family N-acetyltransferase n=1 Tax=Psychrobacillus sp. OK028 TaxID=1884359 RepID=UPI0008813ABC|nr:GNAT family protein [Psychrobacillus sp. OK028]SDN46426.1 ribosomal-protein-alanine N-acetyltransferase [Psychrobacillus sp. OK028]
MGKWILLLGGLAILAGNAWGIYTMYQPRVGPIGNGEIANYIWVSIFFGFLAGLIAIAQFVVLLLYDSHKKRFPKLETERFFLRQIEASDAKEVFRYFSKDEVTKYYDLNTFKDIKEAKVLIKNWQRRYHKKEGFRWGIALKQDNKIIGSCGYHNWEKEHFKAEVGFEVTPEFWRQGVMTEVLQPILRYGFDTMELNRIEALYDPENVASQNTLANAGFVYEGILRKSAFEKGHFCDAAICSLLKEEFVQ